MYLFLPDWIPWWLQLTFLVTGVIFGICFLLMPFAVFGVKGRLSYLDQQMEDIQAQLRILLKRFPEARNRHEIRMENMRPSESGDNYKPSPMERREQGISPSDDYSSQISVSKNRVDTYEMPETNRSATANRPRFFSQSSDEYVRHENDQSYVKPIQSPRARAGEQLYDPPPKEEPIERPVRQKMEPILRWPPK